MSTSLGTPTLWAVLTAGALVLALRPRPPARRPPPPTGRAEVSAQGETDHSGATCLIGGVIRSTRHRVRPAIRALALATWCDGVARAVRAGSSLAVGVVEAPPPGARSLSPADVESFELMVADIRRSVPPQTAPTVSPDLALVAGVLAACLRQGGPAAEPLDRAAGILRARAAEAGERTTQSAQARLSAQVMTALPAAMLAVLIATSASVRVAVSTPAGATALLAGAALNVAGWWWLRRLLRNAAM